MNSDTLRLEIRRATVGYARRRKLPIDDSHTSAVIFRNIADNFHPESFANIVRHVEWNARIQKAHQKVPDVKQMQSSNSSDALLMNIFCHPSIQQWVGIRKILGNDIESIVFGFKCLLQTNNGQSSDKTEIDMMLPNIFCEAKLTEPDFTRKRRDIVERYDSLQTAFHVDALQLIGDDYNNYQIIRNLLAAIQYNRSHMLLCDERRSDLVRSYAETVSCLQDIHMRKRCKVIFWQDIVTACGKDLREWIEEKYGM